jgi:hypothetical protein
LPIKSLPTKPSHLWPFDLLRRQFVSERPHPVQIGNSDFNLLILKGVEVGGNQILYQLLEREVVLCPVSRHVFLRSCPTLPSQPRGTAPRRKRNSRQPIDFKSRCKLLAGS